jgi:signal transduction histidine kinase
MWEKIVLNLLSNAFKFTFEGTIEVSLRQENGHFQLAVTDTGTGIPADELPRLFERFHRVEGAKGRTHEGSGIGLALVQELTRLHGGSVTCRE